MTGPPPPGTGSPAAGQQVCVWHPDRPTGLACSRCGRPACPECLTPASVGFHCRQCIAESAGGRAAPRTISGARLADRVVVTPILIVVNLAAFVVTALQSRSVMSLSGSELYLAGGLIPVEVSSGEYWRLVSSGFLHGNLVHIATNMISLYFLGVPLERILGRVRYLTIYLLSLFGASVSVMLFSAPVSLTIGASGAVYGLMGALLVTFRRLRYDLRQLLVIVALNVFITFQFPGISWQGHFGGLVIGALVGAAMVYPAPRNRAAWQWGTVAAVLVLLTVLVVTRSAQLGEWFCVADPSAIRCVPAH